MLTRPALLAISGDQRWISPYKGFCCAHRRLHGELSCSEYVRRQIAAQGLWSAWPNIRRRFRDCRAALAILSTEQEEARRQKKQKKDRSDRDCHGCDACDLADGCDLPCDCSW